MMGHGKGHGHGMGHGHGKGMGHGHGAATATPPTGETRGQAKGYALIAVVYLLGLIMGALDMSIVNPARTVIQNSMSVDDSLGVWVITIYTLAYAASIPVMGKLADRHGRKSIYLLCIFLFGLGSLLCGFARWTGSFEMLLGARVIQALGGGGIMPVATAEFGTAFPEEKRGMALGMVGMVYGLASIFGPSIGSAILEVFGQTEWQYIFFVNVPICLFVTVFGVMKLPQSKADQVKPIDGLGILILTAMTLSLMYGLKNIDFFDLANSFITLDVWPFILVFFLLLPLFLLRERKAADPIINISYFTNRNIVITMICSVISGIVMMGTIFYPQFCENAMMMKSGSGGYFIALLGLGTAVGSMGGGGLIDKHGVRPVLGMGFGGSVVGSLFMAFVACEYPNVFTVCATMVLSGIGLGFIMGTALNYMMLQNTTEEESNSALATLSLVRSIGTAVAPAIMVAFVVHASAGMQDNLMAVMPKEVNVSPLPYAAQVDQKLDDMRADEKTSEMLEGLDIPKLSDYQTVEVNMNESEGEFDVTVSDEIIAKMKDSDVTTIVVTCKDMTSDMFGQIKPQLVKKATDGLETGLSSMKDKAQEMKDALDEMGNGISQMDNGLAQMASGIAEMDSKINNANSKIATFDQQIAQMNEGIEGLGTALTQMNQGLAGAKAQLEQLSKDPEKNAEAIKAAQARIDQLDAKIKEAEDSKKKMEEGLAGITSAKNGVTQGKNGMTQGKAEMTNARAQMEQGRAELQSARAEMQDGYNSLCETIDQLIAVDEALPALFDEAEANYLVAIDDNAEQIQKVYQQTLNSGFRGMAIFVAICAALGALLLIPYQEKRPVRKPEEEETVETPPTE